MNPAAILRAFADLAPASTRVTYDVTASGEPFVWLGTARTSFTLEGPRITGVSLPHRQSVGRLAALDALHRDERLLREGWVFVAGNAAVDGTVRRVCLPLLSHPVRLARVGLGFSLLTAGDRELTPLVTDPGRAAELEADAQFGGGAFASNDDVGARLLARLPHLQRWIHDTADDAGVHVDEILPPGADPLACRGHDGLVAIVGAGLYVARDVNAPDLSSTLRAWASTRGVDDTAFAALYFPLDVQAPTSTVEPIRSPLPLADSQREAVARARVETVSVFSGAPGNGKSHTVAAVAIDAIGRGESVLVATQSDFAAEVLTDLLDRHPGPTPVVFGNAERREAMAARLATTGAGSDRGGRDRVVVAATERTQWLEGVIARLLDEEARATAWQHWEPLVPALAEAMPGLFDPDRSIDELHALLARAEAPGTSRRARRRSRRAARRLRRLAQAAAGTPLERLHAGVDATASRRASAELAAQGGTHIDGLWDELLRADDELALALGARVSDRARSARDATVARRRAVVALAAALRSGRGRRRMALRRLDGRALVQALPLWVGTLRDIDDLLPPTPALFDLLILDEASQIEQLRAAPALLRAKRVVVSGDPHQLRHVSFLADLDVAGTLERHELTPLTDRLDVRRLSIFDCACGASPVTWLDEHFRSVPHLIEFSARHFYPDPIRLMTRTPATERVDAIDVVTVDRAKEVRHVVETVRQLAADGVRSIGVITPFREQADALEDALIAALDLDQLEVLGLRVGTVHAFQGNERDVVVASLALTDDDAPGRRRFAEDPNLFNVLVTRARRHMIVVTSLVPRPGRGLIDAYLAHAERPPAAVAVDDPATPWAAALARELRELGIAVRPGYPVGRFLVDLCVGGDDRAAALICDPHPEGSWAHIDRHRALARAGWQIREAFESAWSGDATRAAIAITTELRREEPWR